MSPEAPVPVLTPDQTTQMLGGIGNVVRNLVGLGIKPHLFFITGDDKNAHKINELLSNSELETSGLIVDSARPTTQKTRYVANGKHLLRVDEESTEALSQEIETSLWAKIAEKLPEMDAIILSDYKKGVLTPKITQNIIQSAKGHNIPVILDPKGSDFGAYRGATVITPNKKGLQDGSNMPINTDAEIIDAAKYLLNTCDFDYVLVTRSEEGMSLISKNDAPLHIETNALDVFDVSGAGDTVVAALTAGIASGMSIEDAMKLSNKAAGIVVGKTGTSQITFEELNT